MAPVDVSNDGRREVLGVGTGPTGAETFWKGLLRSLAERGLRGVKLVIAEDHKGLRAAASKNSRANQRRCRIHWMRKCARPCFHQAVGRRHRHDQDDIRAGNGSGPHKPCQTVADALRNRAPELAMIMDGAREDVLTYKAFRKEHRSQIFSTNPLERRNGEIK